MSQAVLSAVSKGVFSFALMVVLAGLCALIIRGIVHLLARTQPKAPLVAPELTVPVKPVRDDSAVIAAVIAAAAQATTTPHRIVYLAEQKRSANWITEVRSRHHGGHSPYGR
ncbi:hypothetical protein PQJ75_23200 [Rhodoplanes sp. TEM]|uniref:Oxaloacetate decarboxylase gamma chain n=1 Tax=Rhodoplanes tepidamans TaxID=200616 RepID=A0ABT5JKX6_RHOTP|nr:MULTISPECIES: hypothetical protein [Rhodoplanes]MDC7789906.1 hypothetical protein [Rhodoplanes tepidamans]MDC7986646.1 hypothetical protein [Rhodoplanes sp. TEM]MDQ0354040.1 Na+-transporting methylmalonyl-CoA/oxaloacetate decarboxylase gamma subunit [Rhodoplanes tepidamans]